MELYTDRLHIRSCRADDLDAYAGIVADPVVMRYLTGRAMDRDEARSYLDGIVAEDAATGIARYAVTLRDTQRFVGFCGFRTFEDHTDFGWRYARDVWGRGIGTEAAVAVRDYGRDVLGLEDIVAGCRVENIGSLRIIERLGLPWRKYGMFRGEPDVRHFQRRPDADAEYVGP